MFADNDIRSIRVDEAAVSTRALVDKLIDIDTHRINASDEFVVRKAVFGVLEILDRLERRIADLESPTTRKKWQAELRESLGESTPDQVRLGE